MSILLLGKNGQVGWELQRALSTCGDVVALGRDRADLTYPESLLPLVRELRPSLVVNAAAYTAVDKAESDEVTAAAVNSESVGVLARAVAETGGWLVHYSTDYVFDGRGERAYQEDDGTDPQNAYGRTKRDGEAAIAGSGCRALILRTSWVHAARGANFIRTILRLARERDQLRIVADQVGAPTSAELIADVTAIAVRAIAKQAIAPGIYHLAAGGETSWHGFARSIVEEALRLGAELRAAPEAIAAIPSSEFPVPAARPANSRLDTRKLREALGISLPDWRLHAARTVAELLEKGPK